MQKAENNSKSIRKLINAIRNIKQGKYSKIRINSADEFSKLEGEFNSMVEKLRLEKEVHDEIDTMKTNFISVISHELRNPLTPMKAQLEMIEQGYFGKLNKKQKNSIDLISKSAEQLLRLIEDMLEMSRIESSRLKFSFSKMDVKKVVQDALEQIKGFMPEKKIGFVTNIGKMPIVNGDPGRLSQVLRNFFSNAVKFSPENSVVEIKAEKIKKKILFTVRDEGIGMTSKEQEYLFKPFRQVEEVQKNEYKGSGLGLAICKGIIEAQGGHVWFESVKNKGTKFYFTLPFNPKVKEGALRETFFGREIFESALKRALNNILGKKGDAEFGLLQESGFGKSSIQSYISSLEKRGDIPLNAKKRIKEELKRIAIK